MLSALRRGALLLALVCAALLPLVALNLTHVGSFHFKRFRELTWILYGALAVFALARRDRASFAREWSVRMDAIREHPRFVPAMSGPMPGLYAPAARAQ